MKKRLTTCTFIIGAGICFFFFLGAVGSVHSEAEKAEKTIERPILISGVEMFEKLERPPVQFYHDRHTSALKEEGCGTCHPNDEKKKERFVFTYPKTKSENSSKSLMKSYHSNCLGCHKEMAGEGKKTGPLTCGECHVARKKPLVEHLPKTPDYYQPLDEPYHKDCIACHKKGDDDHKPEDLDWKGFYIKEKGIEKAIWPKVKFDYYLHSQHEKGLDKKCELCHHIYNKAKDKLVYLKGTESSCRDCHQEEDVEKRRTFRKVAHSDCLHCHMERKQKNLKAGPFACAKCHVEGKERTIKEMADIPRQTREKPDKTLIRMEEMGDATKATISFGKKPEQVEIKVEDARLEKVSFDHQAHEGYTRACGDCHHDTLKACKECHTLEGSDKGSGVTLSEAYHDISSPWSCIGCHELEKSKKSCAGCHHLMRNGLRGSSCLVCHSQKTEDNIKAVSKLGSPKDLLPEKLSEELDIKKMEKIYKPSKFPHQKIIKNLTEVSNKSKLAKKFHTNRMTICLGCHHEIPLEPKKLFPRCFTCHSSNILYKKTGTLGLLGAYHRQCLGCHKKMEQKPNDCAGCHAEKEAVPTETSN